MSEHMALENLTVLDLTRVLAGPFCTMMLADMGANVIKIEVPKGGDDTRTYPPFRAKNLNGERESVYFANINRNILLNDIKHYTECMRPGALLFMSGFYTQDIPFIREECERNGLIFLSHAEKNNWVAVKTQKP